MAVPSDQTAVLFARLACRRSAAYQRHRSWMLILQMALFPLVRLRKWLLHMTLPHLAPDSSWLCSLAWMLCTLS